MADSELPRSIRSIVQIYGPVYAKDSVFGAGSGVRQGSPRRETGLLHDRDIELVTGRYVPGPCEPEAAQALGVDHIVVLQGKRGLGKRAAAISLLRSRTDGPLTVLSPASSIQEIAAHSYESGHGYLVVDQADDKSAPPSDFDWHKARDAVREAGAFLVVTRQEPISPEVEIVTAVRWRPPPRQDVVRVYLAGAEHAVDELVEALPVECSLTELVKVASHVAEGESVPHALRRLDSSAVEVVRTWFGTDPTQWEVVEMTALAFSADVTGEDFRTRAKSLGTHLHVDEHAAPAKPNSLVVTGPGGTPTFADARYRDHVLAELWARQPRSVWEGVSAWLGEIVHAGADLSVAFGLSGLAKVDPTMVETEFLEPWSEGGSGWNAQTTAAFVIWALCLDERSVSTALRIVRGWARGTSPQRQTAAIALSGELGVRFPAEAVHELRRLLADSPRPGDDTYADAFGALFSTLQTEGDDGAVVLDLLARLLDDAADRRLSPDAEESVRRSVRAALTARNWTDDRSTIGSFLGDRPDRTDLVGRLMAPLLVDPAAVAKALAGFAAGGAKPEAEDIARWLQSSSDAVAEARTAPHGVPPPPAERPAPAGQPAPPPPPPPPEPDAKDGPGRPYPIIRRHRIEPMNRWLRVLRVVGGGRPDGLPRTGPHEALVFHAGGDCLPDPGRRERSGVLARAAHVSVVDISASRAVRVIIPVPSAEAVPFIVRIRLACTVVDPVAVVRHGTEDAEGRLRDHLCGRPRLETLGRTHSLTDTARMRGDVHAWVRADLKVRGVPWPGLTVELTGVDVFTPPHLTSPPDQKEPDDAD